MRNIIAKFPGKKDGIIVVAGHYDTNLPLPKTYVGANDGGSSTGLLLELADVLRGKQLEGYSVWLVWLDGEEATVHWTDTDSLYGSRHLAQLWQQDGTAKKIKAFLLLDMVGDADLNIDRDLNSTVWLEDLVRDAATRSGIPVALLRPRRSTSKTITCRSRKSASRWPTSSTSITDTTTSFGTPRRTRSTNSAPTACKSSAIRCWKRSGHSTRTEAISDWNHFRLKISDFRLNGPLRWLRRLDPIDEISPPKIPVL